MVGAVLLLSGFALSQVGLSALMACLCLLLFSSLIVQHQSLYELGVGGLSLSWVGSGLFLLGVILFVVVLSLVYSVSAYYGLCALFLGVFGVFLADSWMKFYVFYEGVVFPLFLYILAYGGYHERVLSGFYLLLYTVGLSMPLGLYVLYVVDNGFCGLTYPSKGGWLLLMGVWVAMAVKVPIFGLHGWLPKVHVEASTVGSMVLAGVMIKLGLYGGYLLMSASGSWSVGLTLWWCIGGCVCACACLVMGDVKSVVAYSSVVHMAVVGYVVTLGLVGAHRGLLEVGFMHGVVAVALFYLVGSLGTQLGSRCLVIFWGLFSLLGFSGLLVASLFVLNMGFPLSGGFLGELECLWALVGAVGWMGVLLVSLFMFLGCGFNLYLCVVFLGFQGRQVLGCSLLCVLWFCLLGSLFFLLASPLLV